MQKFISTLVVIGTEYGERMAEIQVRQRKRQQTIRSIGLTPFAPRTPEPDTDWERLTRVYTEKHAKIYETSVMGVLSKIHGSTVGQSLLRAISRLPSWTRIVPYLPSDRDWNNGSNLVLYPRLATRKGQTVAGSTPDENGDWPKGTGAGSNTTLRFITAELAQNLRQLPGGVAVRDAYEAPDPNTLTMEDEVLVHELTHALRGQAGVYDRRTVPNQPRYGNFEEFYAFLVTNLYRSEMQRPKMRNDNHGGMEEQEVIRNGKFLRTEQNRRHLRQFRRDHPILFSEFKRVDAAFNPFRRMVG